MHPTHTKSAPLQYEITATFANFRTCLLLGQKARRCFNISAQCHRHILPSHLEGRGPEWLVALEHAFDIDNWPTVLVGSPIRLASGTNRMLMPEGRRCHTAVDCTDQLAADQCVAAQFPEEICFPDLRSAAARWVVSPRSLYFG
jgi:hypothetical protein